MTARPLRSGLLAALLLAPLLVTPLGARAAELAIPVLVPLTGFLSLEGQSQRNGALLAFQQGPGGLAIRHDVADTGTSPEIAVNALEKALQAKPVAPDATVRHPPAPSPPLPVKQAIAGGLGLPIVSGSAMATPSPAALLEPVELTGICAESASAPILPATPAGERFLADYRKEFAAEPDAYALAQYDGTMMVLAALAAGVHAPEKLRETLSRDAYQGIAMRYRSDRPGNMAHSAIIVCYDGTGRTPKIVKRYDDIAALK